MLTSARQMSASSAAVLALAVGLITGCGGSSGGVAVRVGQTAITKASLDHWTSVIAGGRRGADSSKRQYGVLHTQALDFLISSQWLIDEAAERGLRVSDQEVEERMDAKRKASFPGGKEEFQEFLKTTGQTSSDIMFEARAELASWKIKRLLTRAEPAITQTQIVEYYGRHRQRFAIAERRDLEMTNRKSAAEAERLKREVESGRSFASIAQHESAERPRKADVGDRKAALESLELGKAIFAAKQNVLTGPVKHYADYFLFKVKHITPTMYRPLSQVQGSIEKQLAVERQRRTLAAFVRAWRAKWTARTDCHAGYVVQKCRQYKASKATAREDPLAFN